MSPIKNIKSIINHEKKIITIVSTHILNKGPRNNLLSGRTSLYDMRYQNIHTAYRYNFEKYVANGYSIVLNYNSQNVILRYNG